jgi:GNAT superfamily N-acetyltransferase
MAPDDIPGVVALQRSCFPAPFPEELLWSEEHLLQHLTLCPEAQFVAVQSEMIIGSASNLIISEGNWCGHHSWEVTVGGPFLNMHDPQGSTLYGVDVSVHPAKRGQGVGRALYARRFEFVAERRLVRYGTACRVPDLSRSGLSPEAYGAAVAAGRMVDRTMTPLLRYGLSYLGIIKEYMDDPESLNCAALLERVIA